MFGFTQAQIRRLLELDAKEETVMQEFIVKSEREQSFKEIEKSLIAASKTKLANLKNQTHQPSLTLLQHKLETALVNAGFTQVCTPTIITQSQLERMSVTMDHPLSAQVFWLEGKKCLRPMLAPNLYNISVDLLRIWEKPVRIFEIGSCFRKESQGNKHLNEFTMCNLVEWGTPEDECFTRIKELAALVMDACEISDYAYEETQSEVYGDSLDVVQGDTELASGSIGPHRLDAAFGINSSWVGLGFGLERLLMIKNGANNVHSYARSLSYLDGVRLNIK